MIDANVKLYNLYIQTCLKVAEAERNLEKAKDLYHEAGNDNYQAFKNLQAGFQQEIDDKVKEKLLEVCTLIRKDLAAYNKSWDRDVGKGLNTAYVRGKMQAAETALYVLQNLVKS